MRLAQRFVSTLSVVAALVAWPAARAQGVALVVDRTGTVSIADAAAGRPVATLAVLPAGTRLQLDAASSVTLLYVASGDEYTLTGPGAAHIEAAAVSTSNGASARRRAPGGTKPLQLRGDALTMGGVVMRSGGGLRARHPAGVLTGPPERFVWEAFARNDRYVVELRDAAGAVVFEQRVQGLTLAFPTTLALRPDERYSWTVTVAGEGAALTSGASFTLGPQDLRDEAQRARPSESSAFSDRLVYALWLDQVGALGEARQMWRALADQRPDDDALLARARR